MVIHGGISPEMSVAVVEHDALSPDLDNASV